MDGGTLRIARVRSWLAALSLLTGLLLAASAVPSAFAASPHVRATSVTSSCVSCHSVHAAADSALLNSQGTSGTTTASCLTCHDGTDASSSNVTTGTTDSFGLPSGHTLDAPTSGTARIIGCETCHAVHAASEDSRRIPAERINGAPVSSAGKELCLACHSRNGDWFGPDYPSTSAPTRDATGYPVAGTWTGPETYESTSSAHRLIPEATQTVGVSEPIRREQGDCLYCHAAHGGANDYDGLATTYTVPTQATLAVDQADGSYAALCFTCHGGQTPSGFATAPVDIKRFATAGAGNGGHSIVTSGGTLPVGSPLPCFECHNPHGSTRGNSSLLSDERGASLATTSAPSVRAFCFTCHTTADSASGWDSATGTYTPTPAAEKVVGLSRQAGVLRLPAIAAHTQADPASCYDCHGDSYAAGGTNVHNPGEGEVARFGSNLASVADGGTVPSATAEATAALEATASLGASGGVTPLDTVLASDTVLSTDAVVPMAWPDLTVPVGDPVSAPITPPASLLPGPPAVQP